MQPDTEREKMQDAVESRFHFKNPRIVEIAFKENPKLDDQKYKGFGIQYETKVYDKSSETAKVDLTVQIGVNEETVPFTIKARVTAEFRWDKSLDEELVNGFLNINAKVLLLSYLRPFITHLSVDAGYSPFVLPFFDFTKENNN